MIQVRQHVGSPTHMRIGIASVSLVVETDEGPTEIILDRDTLSSLSSWTGVRFAGPALNILIAAVVVSYVLGGVMS